eukprot:ANDGO_05929.mRNA.1 hypothetical protein
MEEQFDSLPKADFFARWRGIRSAIRAVLHKQRLSLGRFCESVLQIPFSHVYYQFLNEAVQHPPSRHKNSFGRTFALACWNFASSVSCVANSAVFDISSQQLLSYAVSCLMIDKVARLEEFHIVRIEFLTPSEDIVVYASHELEAETCIRVIDDMFSEVLGSLEQQQISGWDQRVRIRKHEKHVKETG